MNNKNKYIIPKENIIKSGFRELDQQYNGGFYKGEVYLLAGDTQSGKTSFCANLAYNLSVNSNKKILLFAPEFNTTPINQRINQRIFEMTSSQLKERFSKKEVKLSDQEKKQLNNYKKNIKFVMVKSEMTFDFIDKYSKYEIDKNPIQYSMIIIDCLQALSLTKLHTTQKLEKRSSEIRKTLIKLNKMAIKYNLPILLTSKLNRTEKEMRSIHPSMKDLNQEKIGENLAVFSENITFLFRKYTFDNPEKANSVDFLIEKNKKGETGKITYNFQAGIAKFKV